ncbi:sensor histidine kinase [Loktanella sp. IMCC34160]|nr:sensor histidine kinase [Loktanella sp. IMCC34160]
MTGATKIAAGWGRLTLPVQFVLAGTVVMTVTATIVGLWVSSRVEQGVVQSSASAAADYVETFVAPLADEFGTAQPLSRPAQQALAELFSSPAAAENVVSYKIWRAGGEVIMASDPDIVGQVFEESDDLKLAWTGTVAASYEDHGDDEDAREAALGIPLLEVYSPVHAYFTGEVVAVVEFYQNGTVLAADLAEARLRSWLVVGSAFLASGLALFGIVVAGGRTIDRQRRMLETQLAETKRISAQNAALRMRVVSASSRAVAQTERWVRQIGGDLHDGPAQHLALASLRLDSLLNDDQKSGADAQAVRGALEASMQELRAISRGLALPDLDQIDLATVIERAVQEHRKRTGTEVDLTGRPPVNDGFDYARKLCVYRFLQETLSNAARHSGSARVKVHVRSDQSAVHVAVQDDGAGFDKEGAMTLRQDGGQGLMGLIDRAESIGGAVTVESNRGAGTTVTLTLQSEETS